MHQPVQSPALYSVEQFVVEMWPLEFAAAEAEPAPEPSQKQTVNQTSQILGQGLSM